MCVFMCAHECRYLQRPEEGIRCLGAGVTGSCELPTVGSGNFSNDLKHGSVFLALSVGHLQFFIMLLSFPLVI